MIKSRKLSKTLLTLAICALFTGSASYAAFSSSPSPWTDWYRKNFISALIELANMRKHLFANNLFSTYVTPPAGFVCPRKAAQARSADGSCNDLNEPWMGAAHTRFDRNIPLSEVKPETLKTGLLEPDPRKISRELLTRHEFKPIAKLNLLAACWIQFMVHDWVSHGENDSNSKHAYFLPLESDDPLGQRFMTVLGTAPDTTRTASDRALPKTFVNEVSSWWDGSQIYGSDLQTQFKLRALQGGKLKMDADGRLPLDSDGVELTGFKRNWWLGLSMMHHLFVNEHNRVAEMLARAHPHWDDQKLFDVARLVTAAVMAKIHTVEWTPAVLHNKVLKEAMRANWYGIINPTSKVDPLFKAFSETFLKNPIIDGLVGGTKDLHGVPYSLSEEFTASYRLHSLLPEYLEIGSERIPLADTRDAKAHQFSHRFKIQDILYSLGTAHPGQLTLNNFPQFMQEIEVPIAGKIDLGTMDIFRDRERGVPRYNRFRRLLNLQPIQSFDELTDDREQVAKIRQVYGTTDGVDNVEKLDLMIGTLAEGHRPTGFGFGETQFQEFMLSASRRLQADRFFTTDYNAETYSQEGLDWVDQASFKTVLLDAYPELSDVLKGLNTAFSPWNAAE